MTSRDFGFITLRNAVAYRPDNSIVPPNNVFVTSTNGGAVFSNNLQLSSINISTANIATLNVSTITGINVLDVSTINAQEINTSSFNANNINISTANIDILDVSTINTKIIHTSSLDSNTINTSTINTSTITVTSLIALPTTTAPSNVLYTDTNKLYFNGLQINTGVISTVSTVYWKPAGDGTTGVITNDNEGNPLSNPLRYLVGVGTNFSTDTRSTLNGTLDIQYRGGNATGNSLFISSNNNTFAVENISTSGINYIALNLNDNNANNNGASFSFKKSNNLLPTNDTSELGFVEFRGTDTNNEFKRASYIISHQQGAAGNGFVPGTLEFFTTADTSHIDQQRMIISSSGQVGINIPTPYKQFQVSTNTKDAVDGIACNSSDVNTIIGAYAQGPFTGDNVGSIQVTRNNAFNSPVSTYTLALNPRGGDIYIGSSIASTFINGGVTISSLTVQTINGQVYDPTEDAHWTGYNAGGGIINVYNSNNGAIGVGTSNSIATGVKFQVNGNSLFNGQISTSNITTPYISSVNHTLTLTGEVYISSSVNDSFAILHLFNDKAKITTNSPYDGFYLEASGNKPIILCSTNVGNTYATFASTGTSINNPLYVVPNTYSMYSTTLAINVQDGGNYAVIEAFSTNLLSYKKNISLCGYGGNVGINTLTPQTTLDIAGNCYISSGLTLNGAVPSGYGALKIINSSENAIFIQDGTATSPTNYNGYLVGTSIGFGGNQSTFVIGRIDGLNDQPNKALYLTQSGNVGIGNTTPVTNLVVNNTSPSISTGFAVQSADVYTVIGNISNGGTNYGSIQTTRGGTSNTIGTTPYPLVIQPLGGDVTTGGNLVVSASAGINAIIDPLYALNVGGNIYANGNLTIAGTAISNVACSTINSDPTSTSSWPNFYGKYCFVTLNGANLSIGGTPTEGTIIVFRNNAPNGNPITINTTNTIASGKTLSFVYTATTGSGAWYSL